jgi:hypothetical protein
MPEQPQQLPEGVPPTAGVQASLHAIAQALRAGQPLDAEARQALAELVDELGNALNSAAVPSAEVDHLAGSTAHLVQALQQRHDAGRLASARGRLERAILAAEAQAPFLAGLARRVLDALANVGI